MKIVELILVDEQLIQAMQSLVAQLSANAPLPSVEDIEKIVGAPESTILVARSDDEDDQVLGMLTLVMFQVPTGRRARIEDVVVNENTRGEGIGETLVLRALKLAELNGAMGVDLTSNPARKVANKLYSKLGFELRYTNVYRYEI